MRIDISSEVPKYVPTTAAEFEELRSYFATTRRRSLRTIIERVQAPDWVRETIAFPGADGERAIAYLYLPIHAARPVQVIHYVPGTGVELGAMALSNNMEAMVGAIRARRPRDVRRRAARLSGAPIGRGAQEPPATTAEFRDKIVNWVTDLRRGLDYLETRTDVDRDRIAFVAQSSGARTGIPLAAVESRYRSVFFHGAGVSPGQASWVKGTNPIEFAPHIKRPTMMLQGRHDEAIRLKTSAEPLSALLREPKRSSSTTAATWRRPS